MITPLVSGTYPDQGLPEPQPPTGGEGEPPRPDNGLPVFPSHPIVIPPDGIAPGVPTHPIYIPPMTRQRAAAFREPADLHPAGRYRAGGAGAPDLYADLP